MTSSQHEFPWHCVVQEVLDSLKPLFDKKPELISVFQRMAEPERMIAFRVAWIDDAGNIQARLLASH